MKSELEKLSFVLGQSPLRTFVPLILLMLIVSVLEVFGVGVVPAFIGLAMKAGGVAHDPLPGAIDWIRNLDREEVLAYGAAALMAFFVFKGVVVVAVNYYKDRLLCRHQIALGERLFRAYLSAPHTFHFGLNSAHAVNRLSAEVRIIVAQFLLSAVTIAMDSLVTVLILVGLFAVEPQIALVVVLGFGTLAVLFGRSMRKALDKFGKRNQRSRSHLVKVINHSLGGLKEARITNREGYFFRQYSETFGEYTETLMWNRVISGLTKPFLETVIVASMLAIILAVFLQGRPLESTVSSLALFGMAALKVLPATNRIVLGLTSLSYSKHAITPVFADLRALQDSLRVGFETSRAAKKMPFKAAIELEALSYTYPGTDKPVIEDITLQIRRGEAVAFVGSTGAGKSTLVDVVLGLLEPGNGRVLVDGRDANADMRAWQKNLGYVPQFIFLADDTLAKNVAFGVSEVDEAAVCAAVRAAQLERLVERLPEGYETILGENGVRLSGGERQRVGIARALYHKPDVLVLDEATSSLDSVTEQAVVDAVETLKGRLTVITVAHRLATVRRCDRIFYLANGRLIDVGSYDQLLERNSEFRRMANLGHAA